MKNTEKQIKTLLNAVRETDSLLGRYKLKDFEDWAVMARVRRRVISLIRTVDKADISGGHLYKTQETENNMVTLVTWMILEHYYSHTVPSVMSLYFAICWLEGVVNTYMSEVKGVSALRDTYVCTKAQDLSADYLKLNGLPTDRPMILDTTRICISGMRLREAKKACSAFTSMFSWISCIDKARDSLVSRPVFTKIPPETFREEVSLKMTKTGDIQISASYMGEPVEDWLFPDDEEEDCSEPETPRYKVSIEESGGRRHFVITDEEEMPEERFDELTDLLDDIRPMTRQNMLGTYLEILKRIGYKCPKDIVRYLDRYVEGQHEAKKRAAIAFWNHLHGLKENCLFVGPSGCGKTHIWRTLSRIPIVGDLIQITDASDITQKGWKGEKKCDSVIEEIFFEECEGLDNAFRTCFTECSIIVYDEFDKLLSPQYESHGSNVSYALQNQMLTMIEGTKLHIKREKSYKGFESILNGVINTENISFIFCGAFEDIYKKREKASKGSYGFGGGKSSELPPITISDIIEYGARPEIAGRIGQVVTLDPLSDSEIRKVVCNPETSPISPFIRTYGIDISLTDSYLDQVIKKSAKDSLGVRGVKTLIKEDIEERMYDNGDDIPIVLEPEA